MLVSATSLRAQTLHTQNPEVESLYRSAQFFLASGAFTQAIAAYQQAINLAPAEPLLHRDLANAFLLSGNPQRAEKSIMPLIEKDRADAVSYAIAANVQLALKEDKKARKLLDAGIERYPHSGYLFHERGKLWENSGDELKALKEWVAGTVAEPTYHLNYYEAARMYMHTKEPLWAMLYGEIFVNLERATARSGETRKLLLAAYKRLFLAQDAFGEQAFGKEGKVVAPQSFEEAVKTVFLRLAPVLSDGISTENLTMLRTRFIMNWTAAGFAEKYPFTLFQMHDDLLREGHFDAYNQWLFGRAENAAQYEAWNKFHPEAVRDYEAYYSAHPLLPMAIDAGYNMQISKKLFEQERR